MKIHQLVQSIIYLIHFQVLRLLDLYSFIRKMKFATSLIVY